MAIHVVEWKLGRRKGVKEFHFESEAIAFFRHMAATVEKMGRNDFLSRCAHDAETVCEEKLF